MLITCRYSDCGWEGTVGGHEIHLMEECMVHKLQCPAPGCDFIGNRREMENHNKTSDIIHAKIKIYVDKGQRLKRKIKRRGYGIIVCVLFIAAVQATVVIAFAMNM